MENKIAKNRTSPKNESDYIAAYLKQNPYAKRKDGLDIAAVTAKDGTKGHGLLPEGINRSHDNSYHRVTNFIPDSTLKKRILIFKEGKISNFTFLLLIINALSFIIS